VSTRHDPRSGQLSDGTVRALRLHSPVYDSQRGLLAATKSRFLAPLGMTCHREVAAERSAFLRA